VAADVLVGGERFELPTLSV